MRQASAVGFREVEAPQLALRAAHELTHHLHDLREP